MNESQQQMLACLQEIRDILKASPPVPDEETFGELRIKSLRNGYVITEKDINGEGISTSVLELPHAYNDKAKECEAYRELVTVVLEAFGYYSGKYDSHYLNIEVVEKDEEDQ
jgi:hypothetical protein